MSSIKAPEQRTIDVDVDALDTRGRTVVGYAAVYGAVSEDLGGFRETIQAGAFADVLGADVRALLNHDPNEVLGRTKSGTLRLHDEQRGLRFELDLPDSPLGENVRTAVARGDIDDASFRFVVGDETWNDEIRTITKVERLLDVTIATFGAYPAASVELRTRPRREETTMDTAVVEETEGAEERTSSTGTLRITDANEGSRGEARDVARPVQKGRVGGGWQARRDHVERLRNRGRAARAEHHARAGRDRERDRERSAALLQRGSTS